jgi:hypothetical protein
MQKDGFDIIAIAEYREEDYPRMVALAPDGGGMEKTFREWKDYFEAAVVAALSEGARVERIVVDPDEFAAWLRRNRLKSTHETRTRYVLDIANKKHGAH